MLKTLGWNDFLAAWVGVWALFCAITGTLWNIPRGTFRIERFPVKTSRGRFLLALVSLTAVLFIAWDMHHKISR